MTLRLRRSESSSADTHHTPELCWLLINYSGIIEHAQTLVIGDIDCFSIRELWHVGSGILVDLNKLVC